MGSEPLFDSHPDGYYCTCGYECQTEPRYEAHCREAHDLDA